MGVMAAQDLDVMREAVFFDGPETSRKLSRFWILLVLASIISAAGVVGDSTATVIGAMIVAPLMTPILGTMLAVITADRDNLIRCLGLVVAGAACAIAIGYLVGVGIDTDVVASTSSQVAGRVSPRLIDLLAALATGVVGSVGLARKDISDTLPGVAIAISLVPPLSVVGLTLESGAGDEALGALLLFTTNVAAILATGTIVMAVYGAHRSADGARALSLNRRSSVVVIAILLAVVIFPLAATSARISSDTAEQGDILSITRRWAADEGWEVVAVEPRAGEWVVRLEGPPPLPATGSLADALRDGGVDPSEVDAELLPRATVELGED